MKLYLLISSLTSSKTKYLLRVFTIDKNHCILQLIEVIGFIRTRLMKNICGKFFCRFDVLKSKVSVIHVEVQYFLSTFTIVFFICTSILWLKAHLSPECTSSFSFFFSSQGGSNVCPSTLHSSTSLYSHWSWGLISLLPLWSSFLLSAVSPVLWRTVIIV